MVARDGRQKDMGALSLWRQGDITFDLNLFIHMADLWCPGTDEAKQAAKDAHPDKPASASDPAAIYARAHGLVVLTQTCDIIRSSVERPYVEVAPLVRVQKDVLEEIRRLKRPAFAYIPAVAGEGFVADLDRTMTVEKAMLVQWSRVQGLQDDHEIRDFAEALARKRSRFAFPNDFVKMSGKMQGHLKDKHGKQHTEGMCLENLREIRVRAAPSWESEKVSLMFWFIKNEKESAEWLVEWPDLVEKWTNLFDQSGRFRVEGAVAIQLEDMTARDYVESDPLDLDHLSSS